MSAHTIQMAGNDPKERFLIPYTSYLGHTDRRCVLKCY